MMKKIVDPLNLPNEVTARVDNDTPGMCPVCKRQMRVLECNQIPAYVCIDDRIVTPTKD
jgi:hypothetical protein